MDDAREVHELNDRDRELSLVGLHPPFPRKASLAGAAMSRNSEPELAAWIARARRGERAPLLIHGPSGCGKKTLAVAVANELGRRVLYLEGEDLDTDQHHPCKIEATELVPDAAKMAAGDRLGAVLCGRTFPRLLIANRIDSPCCRRTRKEASSSSSSGKKGAAGPLQKMEASMPVIYLAEDPYANGIDALRSRCLEVRLYPLKDATMRRVATLAMARLNLMNRLRAREPWVHEYHVNRMVDDVLETSLGDARKLVCRLETIACTGCPDLSGFVPNGEDDAEIARGGSWALARSELGKDRAPATAASAAVSAAVKGDRLLVGTELIGFDVGKVFVEDDLEIASFLLRAPRAIQKPVKRPWCVYNGKRVEAVDYTASLAHRERLLRTKGRAHLALSLPSDGDTAEAVKHYLWKVYPTAAAQLRNDDDSDFLYREGTTPDASRLASEIEGLAAAADVFSCVDLLSKHEANHIDLGVRSDTPAGEVLSRIGFALDPHGLVQRYPSREKRDRELWSLASRCRASESLLRELHASVGRANPGAASRRSVTDLNLDFLPLFARLALHELSPPPPPAERVEKEGTTGDVAGGDDDDDKKDDQDATARSTARRILSEVRPSEGTERPRWLVLDGSVRTTDPFEGAADLPVLRWRTAWDHLALSLSPVPDPMAKEAWEFRFGGVGKKAKSIGKKSTKTPSTPKRVKAARAKRTPAAKAKPCESGAPLDRSLSARIDRLLPPSRAKTKKSSGVGSAGTPAMPMGRLLRVELRTRESSGRRGILFVLARRATTPSFPASTPRSNYAGASRNKKRSHAPEAAVALGPTPVAPRLVTESVSSSVDGAPVVKRRLLL